MKRFGTSYLDIQFRRIVAAELATAKKEVIVVTGEFSAFSNYLELQWAVQEAAKRGVKFRIYSNSFRPGIARKLKSWGCKLYTGSSRVQDHFMIVDGKEAVISRSHRPHSVGERHGEITRRDVQKRIKLFNDLVRNGKPVTRIIGPDALDEWLARPAWTDVPVDTTHMDGELG